MTVAAHPSYSNPTIQEAICEIHFRLMDNADWKLSWYGEFFKLVEEQFPVFQPVTAPVLIEVSQRPPAPNILAAPHVIRYQHASRNLLLQLSETRLTVNVLPDYPGWAQVSEDIGYAWAKMCDVVNPTFVTRIGLRYINRIERSVPNETLGTWLTSTDYIPPGVLRSDPGFGARVSVRLDNQNGLTVSTGDQEAGPGSHGAFILDIDRFVESELSTDLPELLAEASRLHEDLWKVFNSAMGERLERLLRGEIP
jgi:uncharacterized protein (TIGR04255 family)